MGRPAHKIIPLTSEQKQEVEANMRLVYCVVNKHRFKHMADDDQCQEGMVALINSVKRCGQDRSSKLSTYAARAIKNEILDAVRNDRLIHVPIRMFSKKKEDHRYQKNVKQSGRVVPIGDVTHDNPLHPAAPERPEPPFDKRECLLMRKVVQRLPPMERDVVRGLFFRDETYAQLGRKHKLTRQRIWQIKCEAFEKLKTRLAKYA